MSNSKKGFTLVELLVVIGILAILTAAVVIILNPAELLRQARDAQRLSDLDAVKNAVSLYLADDKKFDLGGSTIDSTKCYTYAAVTANCNGRHSGKTSSTTASTVVTGAGWIPLNLAGITSGSPISALPNDPSNTTSTGLFYSFVASTSTLVFEMDAGLESTKYNAKMTTDGGNSATLYEVGTDLTM